LSGLIDEGQKGALSGQGGEKMPRRIPQPFDSTEHSQQDSK
jgi:hypothetical protein